MNDAGIIEHLLKIEADAAALVADAQTEADRRIGEGDKQNRALYETHYQNGAAAREAEYQQETEKIRERCRAELSDYRAKMETLETDTGRFSAVLESLFAGEE